VFLVALQDSAVARSLLPRPASRQLWLANDAAHTNARRAVDLMDLHARALQLGGHLPPLGHWWWRRALAGTSGRRFTRSPGRRALGPSQPGPNRAGAPLGD
jgi:hypothetical protein